MSTDYKNYQFNHHGMLVPVALPFSLPTAVYGAMLAIWHLRPATQKQFPLHRGRPKDFLRFLAWCAIQGRRQYSILRSIPEWDRTLSSPLLLPPLKNDNWANGFSVAMFLYGISRYGYFIAPVVTSTKARNRIARAFWRGDRHHSMLPSPGGWQSEYFVKRFGNIERFVEALRLNPKDSGKSNQQLAEEFGIRDTFHCRDQYSVDTQSTTAKPYHSTTCFPKNENYQNWKKKVIEAVSLPGIDYRTYLEENDGAMLKAGIYRFHVNLPRPVLKKLSWLGRQLKRKPSQFQLGSITARIPINRNPRVRSAFPFGVNLFGYAHGEIGIGEDVRLVALALQSQNVPFCIVNIKPGASVSQKDNSVAQWVVPKPLYAISIFCITGIEQVRYTCEQGLEVFQDRYNIGFWPWELPEWPASCAHAFATVDEIWGISSYAANAYRRSPCPVYTMSLPVAVDEIAPMSRRDFDLPSTGYLFIFSFDFNSTTVRKNPAAVIDAFQHAFNKAEHDNVGLVLKSSHAAVKNKEWEHTSRIIDSDPRIHLIDTTLRRPELLALYQCCDCYVSLHRAEGFGRGLAEALLLDLQLITTGFSGNMDYCKKQRVGLVKYKRREVRSHEYFHADGQFWAEPDIHHAAELMYSVYRNPKPIRPIEFDFTPSSMGKRYLKRLNDIRSQLI